MCVGAIRLFKKDMYYLCCVLCNFGYFDMKIVYYNALKELQVMS